MELLNFVAPTSITVPTCGFGHIPNHLFAMSWTPDTATASVFATLILHAIIGSTLYLLFECFRGNRELFWPKRRTKPYRCPEKDLKRFIFGWIWSTLVISDEETLRLVGTDGVVLLRFLRLCTKVCLGCGTFACIFLLPIYDTAFGDNSIFGVNRITMANIAAGGTRLWAPFFCTWIFTIVLLYYLYKEFEFFVALRHNFLAKGDIDLSTQHLYSIVVENIPPGHKSSAKLYALFESLFPGQVVSAQVGIADSLVVEADAQRQAVVAQLEQAVAAYEASDRQHKPMVSLKDGKAVLCGGEEQVEAIPHYLKEVQRLNATLQALKAQAKMCGAGTTAAADRLVLTPDTPGNSTAHNSVYYSAPVTTSNPKNNIINYVPTPNSTASNNNNTIPANITTDKRFSKSVRFANTSSKTERSTSDPDENTIETHLLTNNKDYVSPGPSTGHSTVYYSAPSSPVSPTFRSSPHTTPVTHAAQSAVNTQHTHSTNNDDEASVDEHDEPITIEISPVYVDNNTSSESHDSHHHNSTTNTTNTNNTNTNNNTTATTANTTTTHNTTSMPITPFGAFSTSNKQPLLSPPIEETEPVESTRERKLRKYMSKHDIASTGFVTFRSKCTQMTAARMETLLNDYPLLRAVPAPCLNNIVWGNVAVKPAYIRVASLMTRMAYCAGLIFWTVILAGIAAITSVSTYENYLPFLKDLDSVSYAVLEGQLPVLALIIVIALLPIIFYYVSIYIERRKTIVEANMQVFTWYFLYQIANVYLILFTGSVFKSLDDAVNRPTSVVSLLAASLPSVSTLYIDLMIAYLFSGVPLTLLRVWPVIVCKVYLLFVDPRKLTRRTLVEGPLADIQVDHAYLLAYFLYILCIALTYWVIAPILVFVAGLVFGANYAVYKYQLCYIMVNNNETGGLYFYKLFNYTMTGLMASTITMIVYTGLKEGAIQAPLMAPLPVLIYFVWCYTEEKFKDLSLGLTYQQALHSDNSTPKEDALEGGHTTAAKLQADFFQHPLLRGRTDALPQVYRVRAQGPSPLKPITPAEGNWAGELIPLLTKGDNIAEEYYVPTYVTLEDLAAELDVSLEEPGGGDEAGVAAAV